MNKKILNAIKTKIYDVCVVAKCRELIAAFGNRLPLFYDSCAALTVRNIKVGIFIQVNFSGAAKPK